MPLSSSSLKSNVLSSWNISEETACNFIKDVTNILAEYSWVYVTRNTEIFIYDVLEKIPIEWVEAITALSLDDYRKLPFVFMKDSWPESLKNFLTKSTQLAELRFPKPVEYLEENDSFHLVKKNMPLKKQNEIVVMSNLVNQICNDVKCHKVLDVGSGLGNLDQFLHQTFGLQCVGVDSSKQLTDGAKQRLEGDPCKKSMLHETIYVQNKEDCIEELQVILKNADNINLDCMCKSLHFPEDFETVYEAASYVMVGLHCCGNLMQDMMKIFCSMNELKAFVCVGCCYNKINLDDFPMSQTVLNSINSLHEDYAQWHPCISGLRLASHATRAELHDFTPKDLEITERNLIFRGILEYYIRKENINWHKPRRRVRTEDLTDFERYCDTMFQNDKEILSDTDRKERMKKLTDIFYSKQMLFPRVKVLLILQILLQPLYECFVMLDRMFYFKEKSIETKVCILWDDYMSPRNMALCAFKG